MRFALVLLSALLLVACGQSENTAVLEPERDITPEMEAYFAAHPDFFQFKTLADLPVDLTWENGDHLPEVGSPKAKKGGTFFDAIADFPRTLRLMGPDSNGSFRRHLREYIAPSLAPQHPDFVDEHIPGIAREWALDPENATVYVKLDPSARWSDGVPITSDDMMFLFFMARSPYILSPWFNNNYSTQFKRITRYDDYTLSVTLPSNRPNLAYRVLNLQPLPKHFFKELGDDYVQRYDWKPWPTSGPYILHEKDVKKGQSIAFTRNKDWWAKDKKHFRYRYNPDRIHFSVIREPAKQFEAFRRGDLDTFILNLTEDWYEKLNDNDPDVQNGYIQKTTFYNERPRGSWGLWINRSKPLLNDINIRKGIQYATNWQLVIDRFYRGDYVRLRNASEGYGPFTHPDIEPHPFDINIAQEHFAKAGFTERGPDGILVNDKGERLSFTLTTGYADRRDVVTILKEEASKAGLELRLELLDKTAGFKMVIEKKHDINLIGFRPFAEMFPRYWETYHSDNAYDDAFLEDGTVNPDREVKVQTNNLSVFAIPEADKLIDRYRFSSDVDEMIEIAHQMQEIIHEDASWVPGPYRPFVRVGHWRWVQFPDNFIPKLSNEAVHYHVHWIDQDIQAETREARKDGETFPPAIRVFDQHLQ